MAPQNVSGSDRQLCFRVNGQWERLHLVPDPVSRVFYSEITAPVGRKSMSVFICMAM